MAEIHRRPMAAPSSVLPGVLYDQRLAEEVAQEVFLRLWREPERFDPSRGSLRSFLLSITHSRAIDLLRSETSRRAREERARRRADGGYDLEQEIFDVTTAENVRGAVSKLPDPERKAIELAYFGGHTYREVAAIMKEPEGTVKSRIRSALRRMRHELASVTGDGER